LKKSIGFYSVDSRSFFTFFYFNILLLLFFKFPISCMYALDFLFYSFLFISSSYAISVFLL